MHNFNEYNLEETHKICLINLVAQMLAATDRELFYHTWEKKDSTHYYEVDFLVSEGGKQSWCVVDEAILFVSILNYFYYSKVYFLILSVHFLI